MGSSGSGKWSIFYADDLEKELKAQFFRGICFWILSQLIKKDVNPPERGDGSS